MRKSDRTKHLNKVKLLAEQRYLESKGIISEDSRFSHNGMEPFMNIEKNGDLNEEIEKGKFTEWCKTHGFEDGPSKSCAEEAMEEKYGPDVHKMSTFYTNAVQP